MNIPKSLILFTVIFAMASSCQEEPKLNEVPEIVSIIDSDAFDEESEVTYTLDDDFEMQLWGTRSIAQ